MIPFSSLRNVSVGVLGVAMLMVVTGVLYGLVNPALQSPDELAHFDLARSIERMEGWPGVRGRFVGADIFAARSEIGWDKDAYRRAPGDAPPRSARSTFEELPHGPSGQINHVTQHPPLYYVGLATAFEAVSTPMFLFVESTHDRVLSIHRVLNALALGVVPLCVGWATSILGGDRRRQIVAAMVPLAVPQFLYIGSSVNNDNLMVVAAAVMCVFVARISIGESTLVSASAFGAAAAAAVLSKAFGLIMPVWLVAAYVAAALAKRLPWRRAMLHAAVAVCVSTVVGVAWWLRNVVVYGELMPAGHFRTVSERGFDPSFWAWSRGYLPRIGRSFWGNFGYLDVPMPLQVVTVATVVGLLLLTVAFIRGSRRDGWIAGVFLLPFVMLTVALGADNFLRAYPDYFGRFAGAQGRYWFGAIPAVAVLIGAWSPWVSRRSLVVGVTFAVAIQVIGITTLISGLYQGGLAAVLPWAPWPSWVTLSVVVVCVLGALGLIVTVLRGTTLDHEVDRAEVVVPSH